MRTFLLLVLTLLLASCGGGTLSPASPAQSDIPPEILAIMARPRYADATWSLLVTDVDTGESFYALNADRLSFTGSTRKLFSVGTALNELGAGHRQVTRVHRLGTVTGGALQGDLALVAAGDLVFGGRRIDADTVQFTDFDHNDAGSLGTAILTPQDPLFALDDLASQIRAQGITAITGDVVIDSRLFDVYRVPNGNLLITPMVLNDNMVDVTLAPTTGGQPATFDYRPQTAAFTVTSSVITGEPADIEFSDDNRVQCAGTPGCSGTVQGTLPVGYRAPLSGSSQFVNTFRVEDPDSFVRTAFIEALGRQGITVAAPPVAPNPEALLPASYPAGSEVAAFSSAPYAQQARLILKVSLNLGANLALSQFGLTQGERTVQGALQAERATLISRYGVDGALFDFPTNGSGTPDSQAAPRALSQFLVAMTRTPVAAEFEDGLPILGVDGSLATLGRDLPARGHVFAKTGTTVGTDPDGIVQLKAQNLAGYIDTRGGRRVAYVLMVNDAGPLVDFEADIGAVLNDEAAISNIIYESL